MTHESNAVRWRRQKTVQYVRVEIRPAKTDDSGRCTVIMDWCPAGDSGAHDAFEALLGACKRQRTPGEAALFYRLLHDWAVSQ